MDRKGLLLLSTQSGHWTRVWVEPMHTGSTHAAILWRQDMKVKAYIHSLKDQEHDRHVLGEAEIIACIGDNLYIAEYNGVRCTAIFNFFTGAYYVDDVYGIQGENVHA